MSDKAAKRLRALAVPMQSKAVVLDADDPGTANILRKDAALLNSIARKLDKQAKRIKALEARADVADAKLRIAHDDHRDARDWANTQAMVVIKALKAERARYRAALRKILDELGVPGKGYPAPVENAVNIARDALREKDDE